MTRARRTLTLCEAIGAGHAFTRDAGDLCLRTRPAAAAVQPPVLSRTFTAQRDEIYISWPGKFDATARVHQAIAELEVGEALTLRRRGDAWELASSAGEPVGRMAAKFEPPPGAVVAVCVAAILTRQSRPGEQLRVARWEYVLPQFDCLP